jgi:hypothetical protein
VLPLEPPRQFIERDQLVERPFLAQPFLGEEIEANVLEFGNAIPVHVRAACFRFALSPPMIGACRAVLRTPPVVPPVIGLRSGSGSTPMTAISGTRRRRSSVGETSRRRLRKRPTRHTSGPATLADEKPAGSAGAAEAWGVADPDIFELSFDARGFGRALLFRSALAPHQLAARAVELWPGVSAYVGNSSPWLASGEIEPGLFLALLCGYQPGEFELILERHPDVHPRIAGRCFGAVVGELWHVAQPQPGLGNRSETRSVV